MCIKFYVLICVNFFVFGKYLFSIYITVQDLYYITVANVKMFEHVQLYCFNQETSCQLIYIYAQAI